MKWFLQFLSIGSVVLYTLLIIIDERIPDSAVENTLVSEAQPKQRRLSVWDSTFLTGLSVKIGKLH